MRELSKDHFAMSILFVADLLRRAIQGEFLVIHPFREGNARTIKLMTNLLAAQTDRPLLEYGTSQEKVERYTEGAKAAF